MKSILVKWYRQDVILKVEESCVSMIPQKAELMCYSSIRESSPTRNKSGGFSTLPLRQCRKESKYRGALLCWSHQSTQSCKASF